MIKFKALLTVVILLLVTEKSLAQECVDLITEWVGSVKQECSDLAAGQACYGAGTVTVSEIDTADTPFADAGDLIALGNVGSLQTATDEAWGAVLMSLPVGEESITLALFGGAEMTNVVEALPTDLATVNISNAVGYDVNLREGAGTEFPVVGAFAWNASAVADGRNENGQWLRLQRSDGIAWVSAGLVTVEGDLSTLTVLDSPYTEPMQAFTLTTETDQAACGQGSSGLLIQSASENTTKLQINGVDLSFGAATLLVHAQANAALQVHVIDGDLDLKAQNETVTAATGASVEVALGGENGLTPTAAPGVKNAYSFAAVDGVPLTLVSDTALICIAGVNSDETAAYSQPNGEARVSTTLESAAHYAVTGWSETESGELWWQLTTERGASWIPQNEVLTAGLCSNVLQVDLSAPVVQNNTNSATQNISPAPSGFVPGGRSVWQATSGQDNTSGTCSFPPLVMCNHLAAVTLNGDGSISWRWQEPLPYTLYPAGENAFSFSGRNGLNNANMNMFLTFTSEGTWSMTMTQVFDNDPQCTHTFYYNATRNW